MKKWLSRLWLLAPLCIIAGSGVAVWQILKPADVSVVTNCTAAQASNFTCWKQHYSQLVTQQSPEAAFADFKANYNSNPFVKSNCHQIAHVIGRTAAKQYGDLTQTYAHGDNFCWSGYYHGAIETVAQQLGPTKIIAQLNDVCDKFKKTKQYSFDHFNCVHGMGHGLMAVQGDDLFKALKSCRGYEGNWQQQSCYGGVFMENVMNEINPGEHSNYLKTSDALYPCDAIDDTYKTQCYLMQTSHALNVEGQDFSKVFGLCATVPSPYDAVCYQSLGRDASGNNSSDQAITIQRCNLGQSPLAQQNCYTGAVKDFISFYHSDKQGLSMCSAITDASLSASCTQVAVEYYKSF
jgi:hypothetical protein